jgi:hypothetical protein
MPVEGYGAIFGLLPQIVPQGNQAAFLPPAGTIPNEILR